MKPNKLVTILVLIISAYSTELITSLPAFKEKPKARRGYRTDLNETGHFLYEHPHSKEQKLLCKNCSERALSDSTYQYEQQEECIGQNFEKYKGHHMAPYCNVGNDLGCGLPPEAVKNSHWNCDTGYSDIVHTVYSTCQLVCNSTSVIVKEIYCREILQWYTDSDNTKAIACREPLLDKDGGTTENIMISILVPVVVVSTVLACILLGIVVWRCVKWKQRRRNSRGARDDSKRASEYGIQMGNLQNSSPSIGSCSIGEDVDNNESDNLLTNPDVEEGHQCPDSVDSALGTEGQTPPNCSSSDGHSSKEDSVGSPTDKNQWGTQLGSSSNSNSSSSSQGCTGGRDSQRSSVVVSKSQSVSNNLGTSDKSAGTDNSSMKGDNNEPPCVRVFVPDSRTSESGLNNIRLQGNIYSAPKGSNVYFVPSNCEVKFTSIKRKGDEEELQGWLYDENIKNMYVLKDIAQRDAGTYIFTLAQRVGNTDQEFTDVIELFVGQPDLAQCAHDEACERHVPVTNDQIQGSTNTQDNNSLNSIAAMTPGQRLITERPPPEGAENDHHISGPVKPPYNGARPKTTGLRMTQTNVLISGQSNIGNQDIPRMTSGVIVSNDLNKMQKESKNNLNQFDSPRNISANEKNLMSIENNIDSLSTVENSGRERYSGLHVPHLCTDSIVSHKSYTSENNNSRQFQGTAGSSEGESQTEHTLSTGANNASAKESIEKPSSLKMPSGPSLGLDSMLSSRKDISENYLVHVHNSHNGNPVLGTETDSEGESPSGSVELPINILELKPQDDFSELVSSEAEGGSARNPPVVNSTNVPWQPMALNHEGQVARREDPSGQVVEPVVTEGRPISVHETAVKPVYQRDADIRGERSVDITSPLEPSGPQVGPLVGREVRPERGAVGVTSVGDTGLDPPQLAVRAEPIVAITQPVREAGGREASENARKAQVIEERTRDPCQCNTPLKSISDSRLLQEVSYRGNPIQRNGEARSWFGLALYYGHERHFLDALEYALQSQIDTGPMHHLMTNLFVKAGFKVGHIVRYFTMDGSDCPDLVNLLIDHCDDHVDCRYCEGLRRRSRAMRK